MTTHRGALPVSVGIFALMAVSLFLAGVIFAQNAPGPISPIAPPDNNNQKQQQPPEKGPISPIMPGGNEKGGNEKGPISPIVPGNNNPGNDKGSVNTLQPTSQPAGKDDVKVLLDYLEKEYAEKMRSSDWVTRSMVVISLARIPRETATAKLIDIAGNDRQPEVRLLAWQAVLARAKDLDAKADIKWLNATYTMCEKNMFNGPLRPALLRMLAAHPPNERSKNAFGAIFKTTSAWESDDITTLNALGACLAQWRSGPLVEALIREMGNVNNAVRAEYVLQKAGFTAPTARSLLNPKVFDGKSAERNHPDWNMLWMQTQTNYAAHFAKERANWKEKIKLENEPWRDLEGKYVEAPIPLDQINPKDAMWREDLEMGRVKLATMEVVFCLDVTGSMGMVLNWLKRDVGKTMMAIQEVAGEPKIGITFYRDKGDAFVTRHVALNSKVEPLRLELNGMTAEGGGDIPESVFEGLSDAVKNNRWTQRADGAARIVILLGDAPPHAETIDNCAKLAKEAAEKGIIIHAAKITTDDGRNDLSSFDKIVAASGGTTVAVEFFSPSNIHFLGEGGKEVPLKTIPRPEAQLVVALAPNKEQPGDKILVNMLSSAINPKFRDRVEPLVKTLLAYCEQPSEPEVRLAFPANTPPLQEGKRNIQGQN